VHKENSDVTATTNRERSAISRIGGAFPGAPSAPGSAQPGGRTIVSPRDSLDFAGAPALRELLIDVLRQRVDLLILDLSRVPAADAAGLAVLIGAQRRARDLGVAMYLVAPSLPVSNALRATGLNKSFTIYPDLPAALAAEHRDSASRRSGQGLASTAARAGGAVAA
jgi:anti-anti-sigma factor